LQITGKYRKLYPYTYTVDEMLKAEQEVEKTVLNKAISLISRNKVFTNGNKTVAFE
jgi:formyltetrahydrofolate hydrolase